MARRVRGCLRIPAASLHIRIWATPDPLSLLCFFFLVFFLFTPLRAPGALENSGCPCRMVEKPGHCQFSCEEAGFAKTTVVPSVFFFFGSLLFLIQRCLFLDLCCSARKQKSGRFRSVLCGGSEVRALLFFFVLVAEGIWILLLDASVLARELLVFGGGCQLSCADSRAPSSRHDALPCWSNIVLFCCCLWRRFCLEVRCGQGSSSALFFW